MKALKATWDEIMAPATAAAVETDEAHPEVSDIPTAQ
ncbi:zinc-protease [Salmonella enterica subsp. arizonae]|nr:zinc-protease [Salmonella enterica subsp. arizonae]